MTIILAFGGVAVLIVAIVGAQLVKAERDRVAQARRDFATRRGVRVINVAIEGAKVRSL